MVLNNLSKVLLSERAERASGRYMVGHGRYRIG